MQVVRSMVPTLHNKTVENGFNILDVIEGKRPSTGHSVLRPLVTYKAFSVLKGHIRNEVAFGPSLDFQPSVVDVRRKSRVHDVFWTHSGHPMARQRAIDHHQDARLLQCADAFPEKRSIDIEVGCPTKIGPSSHGDSST